MTADQMLTALWRRKGLVGAIAAAVFVAGAAVVAALPSVYTATSVVRVEPQRPQVEMVSRTLSELIEERLLTVRQELLARPVLQKAVEELNLYPDVVSKNGVEAGVEALRKDLDVKVEGQSAFELTYSGHNAEVVAKVANRIPQIYAEQTVKLRQDQAARATELFSDEVKSMKISLAEWERKIAQFKVDHIGELPEQLELNMRALERLTTQLNTKSEELRIAEGRRSDLARSRYNGDTEIGRLQATEHGLTMALSDAKAQWTEDHPEVLRISKELTEVRTRRAAAEGSMTAEKQEKGRVGTLIQSIQDAITQTHQQMSAYQARLEHTPRWAHELSAMTNDYEIVKAKYASVVSRKVEAELAQDLEARSGKTLFNVVSPAGVPTGPAKPDRMTGFLIVLLVAIGLGVLVGVVLEMRDDSVRDLAQIKERLPIPVLAVVPAMAGKVDRRVLLPASRNTVTPPSLN